MKKLIALVATAFLSLNASAGYVQYDLTGPVSGFIIQHEDDGSIASYRLHAVAEHVWADFFPSGSSNELRGVSTNFRRNGPTNISLFSDLTDYYIQTLSVSFAHGRAGAFDYSARYNQSAFPGLPETAPYFPLSTTLIGSATRSSVSDFLAAGIDAEGGYVDGISRMVPEYVGVPEPTSIALIGLGFFGVAARRKAIQKAR